MLDPSGGEGFKVRVESTTGTLAASLLIEIEDLYWY
jgi:hypothetical protein